LWDPNKWQTLPKSLNVAATQSWIRTKTLLLSSFHENGFAHIIEINDTKQV